MTPASSGAVVAAALPWLGTPYRDQQSVRGAGCDCLGLLRGVWREVVGDEPFPMPAYTRDWGEVARVELFAETARRAMLEIEPKAAGVGAVVVFRMRHGAIAKHCGVLVSERSFIHARERLGVIEEAFTPAWRRRVAFAFLFPRSE